MAKYDVMITQDGVELPYEMFQICNLLAKRRGETTQAVFNKIFIGLMKGRRENGGASGKRVLAELAAWERYCKAEGIENVEHYRAMQSFLGCRAALRAILKELRAEPWRKDYLGDRLDD